MFMLPPGPSSECFHVNVPPNGKLQVNYEVHGLTPGSTKGNSKGVRILLKKKDKDNIWASRAASGSYNYQAKNEEQSKRLF